MGILIITNCNGLLSVLPVSPPLAGDAEERGPLMPNPKLKLKPMPTTVTLTTDTAMDTALPVTDSPMSTDSANAQLNLNLTMDTPSAVTTVTVTVVVLLDTPPVSLTPKEAPKVSARGPLKNLKKRLPPLPVPALNTLFPEPRALPSSKLLTFSPTSKETWARGPPMKSLLPQRKPLLWLTAFTP